MIIKYIQYQTRADKDNYFFNRPNGIDEYVLILAHTPAYFYNNNEIYLLENHQMFIYDKHQPQRFYSSGVDFVHDWFHFDMTKEEDQKFREMGIPFGSPISLPDSFIFSDYIRILAYEHNQQRPHSETIISNLMESFFLKLSDTLHISEDNKKINNIHYNTLSKIRMDIQSFPYRDWTLEEVAEASNMSKSWFQYNYKSFFNISFKNDLIKNRIEYAKKLMIQSEDKLEAISTMCGYNNSAHFMRQFKTLTGFTPTSYRKQYKINHMK